MVRGGLEDLLFLVTHKCVARNGFNFRTWMRRTCKAYIDGLHKSRDNLKRCYEILGVLMIDVCIDTNVGVGKELRNPISLG